VVSEIARQGCADTSSPVISRTLIWAGRWFASAAIQKLSATIHIRIETKTKRRISFLLSFKKNLIFLNPGAPGCLTSILQNSEVRGQKSDVRNQISSAFCPQSYVI
jgi:hypothetical protein